MPFTSQFAAILSDEELAHYAANDHEDYAVISEIVERARNGSYLVAELEELREENGDLRADAEMLDDVRGKIADIVTELQTLQ